MPLSRIQASTRRGPEAVEGRKRPGTSDVMALRVGHKKLTRETGWEPKVGLEEGLKETPMHIMAFIQKLRVPLYPKKKRVSGRLNGLDHAIHCHRCRDEAWSNPLDGLMMGAIDAKGLFPGNAMEEAVWRHANAVADSGGRQW